MVAAIGFASAAVGAAGSVYSSNQNKKAAQAGSTQTNQIDPRLQDMLYGTQGGGQGLLNLINSQAQTGQQTPGLAGFGQANDNYLGSWGANALMGSGNAAQNLQGSNLSAPQIGNINGVGMTNAPQVGVQHIQTTQVQAPSQNNLNLSGAFDKTINGDAGANPYLLNGLKAATDLTNASFKTNQDNVTNALQRNVLPGIRSGAIASGQYGGSRQGIAEGLALSDYTNQLTNANTQLGAANSANTTAQQANAYNQGQDRSLSALLNLSGQQYNVSGQNAELDQRAQMANQQAINGNNLANAQLQQGTNQMNQQAQTTNAGLQQQVNLANQQAQQNTNSLNSQNQAAGIGLSAGLLGQQYGYAQNNSNATLDRLTRGAAALSPYSGVASQTSTSPYYSNTAVNALGGAAAGRSLWDQFSSSGNTSQAPSNQLF